MKFNLLPTILIFFLLLLFNSCEKEININLNASNPKFVIEGNISNVFSEAKIKITKTLNFNETIDYPLVSGALVTITDSTMNVTDTLFESIKGLYTKQQLIGKEGHTYIMFVKIGTETFKASSTMPYRLKMDSIIQQNLAGTASSFGPPAGTPAAGSIIQLLPEYLNTTHTDKFFQFIILRNDSILNRINLRSDLGSNSTNFSIPFPLFVRAKKDDTVTIDLQFIDKNVYNYLYGLTQNLNQFSASPSNPTTNITNGALGYFSAHTSQKETLIIK